LVLAVQELVIPTLVTMDRILLLHQLLLQVVEVVALIRQKVEVEVLEVDAEVVVLLLVVLVLAVLL
tara:strand:- start:364 stop:561 length:198 start_codon:yes stop_codon:yes gene_type:complete